MRKRLDIPFIFFVFFAFIALGQTLAAPPQDLAGHWEGTIDVPGSKLEVNLDFVKQADSSWKGGISIPVQGAKDMPLAAIKVDGADVAFAIAGVPGDPMFKGQMSSDGAKITGKFSQGGGTFPFELARAADPAAKAKKALEGFDEIVAKCLAQLKVPGAAIAIVKDKEVIFSKGFGFRDVDGKLPMTADTLMAI